MSEITGRPARLADYVPPKHKSNGPPLAPLPEVHQHDLEATLREHFAMAAERDELRKEVAELKTELAASKAANMMMESNVAASESRVVSYQLERDKAVAERAKWETLFVSFQAQLESFIPPTLPLVKEAAAPFEE
jgi:hypothetical protein